MNYEFIWLDNNIPLIYKKKLKNMQLFFYPLLVIIYVLFMIFVNASLYYLIISTIAMILLYAILPWVGRNKIHPIEIAFTEKGVHLKRPSGKIKTIPWKKIRGLRLGKNDCIFANLAIYLFGEAKAEALYYFKKYGVKSNPKLEKVIENIQAQSDTKNLNKYLNKDE